MKRERSFSPDALEPVETPAYQVARIMTSKFLENPKRLKFLPITGTTKAALSSAITSALRVSNPGYDNPSTSGMAPVTLDKFSLRSVASCVDKACSILEAWIENNPHNALKIIKANPNELTTESSLGPLKKLYPKENWKTISGAYPRLDKTAINALVHANHTAQNQKSMAASKGGI